MSASMIFRFDVSDSSGFAPCRKMVPALILKHGGEVVVADFAGKTLEGESRDARAIVKFPSEEQALAFYHDPDYTPLKDLRSETTVNSAVALVTEFVRPV